MGLETLVISGPTRILPFGAFCWRAQDRQKTHIEWGICTLNMAEGKEIHIESEVRQVGDHLACFIPAHEASKMDLAEGEIIDVYIRKGAFSPNGLLEETGLAYERFDRNEEGLWDERL